MLLGSSPLQISPVFKPKSWGRSDLAPLYGRPGGPRGHRRRSRAGFESSTEGHPGRVTAVGAAVGESSLIGEVRVTDDSSRFKNGPLAGMTLGDAVEQCGTDLLGKSWKHRRFSILAKYVFTSDWLSVRVHPDDEYASSHEATGSPGKTEMWYIVKAERRARCLLSVKPGVTTDQLRQACLAGESRGLLQEFRPEENEAIFVPARTAHALGPGLILFQVEENSDLSYRLDDFGRVGLDGKPRPLDLERGMAVVRPELPCHRDLPLVMVRERFGSRRFVLATPHFAMELLLVRRTAHLEGSPDRVEVLSVLEGEGRIETEAGWLGYRTGETWLVPPSVKRYRLIPVQPTRLFRLYLPDLERDIEQPLARCRIPRELVEQIRFG